MPSPEATLHLDGIVGVDFTAATVRAQLDRLQPAERLTVRINSDGGQVAEGVAIYALLSAWPGGVDTEVYGWALSAASLIMMAGQNRRMHGTSLVMVHAPWLDQGGNAEELRRQAAMLDTVAQSMHSAYARSGQPARVVDGWLSGADHWFTADQALAVGLVNEIVASPALAVIPHNVYAQRHTPPQHITERILNMPTTNHAPAPAPAPAPATAEAIRAEAVRAEGLRRDALRSQFDIAARHTSNLTALAALRQQCESDPSCTPEAAGVKLLALLGQGIEPANGGGPRIDFGTGDQMTEFKAAATDMLLARSGIRVADPHPAARDLHRMSVVSLAERVLSMSGRSTRGMSPAQILAAGMSTSDFASLLANVAGKSLREGYRTAPATHARWTSEREVPDFKETTLVSLSEAPSLVLKVELGEYKAGSLTDSATKFKAETFGRMLMFSREALLNDDLGALTGIPNAFGASARRVEADKVYGLLTGSTVLGDGLALFHATHGNLAGTGAPPSVATIGAARAAMRKQKDIAGEQFIDPQPRFLLVPVALETACEQLLATLQANDPASAVPDWIRGLELVADPRLDAASATAWYLASNPAQLETIVRAYITGEDRPYLEESNEFARDAVATKARLDLAVGVVDWRGLYKNPGA